jgi:hypothetical protein
MRESALATRPRCADTVRLLAAVALLLATALPATAGGTLQVVSTSPGRHQARVSRTAPIRITFDRPLLTSSITAASFRVFGRWSGPVSGPFTFSDGDRTVTVTPIRPFSAGESAVVNLANTITAADGSPLRSAGHAFQFWIASRAALREFTEIDTLVVRTNPGTTTRAYGGLASDYDLDGWLDLAIVNEDTHDLRVFMNRADGSGLYEPFLQPTTAIGVQSSPNEPADFNNDGLPDAATANVAGPSVSIVLGKGDGTFHPQQAVAVGATPHGIAVLDVDGDGDSDIVTANTNGNNLSRLLNDGSGGFGAATHFEGGGSGEYSLGAGDMNHDGIFDLVVGTRNDQSMHVLLGIGDGTFAAPTTQAAGGSTWMLALGDVDGDLDLDVATANGASNNGAILKGNGDGTLGAPAVVSTSGSMVGSDLGDLDGDGDLDWALSSFGGSRWHLYANNGSGTMVADQQIFAPANASCAIFLDFDNDADLDLALVDEVADVVLLMANQGDVIFADGFEG